MKKLKVLKWVVDILWIFSMPLVLLIIGYSVAIFFIDLGDLGIALSAINFDQNDRFSKVLFVVSILNYVLIIAALYFFRKVLNHFIRVKIFEGTVITSFKKTGNLLIISGLISLIISIIGEMYFNEKVSISFVLNQNIVTICLGLFFLVLSEIFKIAKNTKQENDLTI
jgi:hypothetical protein